MLMRIVLWAILVGSVAMTVLGFQTGSATNAVVGISIFLVGGLILYFILKGVLHFGLLAVKIILFLALIILLVIGGIKGCQVLRSHHTSTPVSQSADPTADLASQTFDNAIPKPDSLWGKTKRFFSFSGSTPARQPQPVTVARKAVQTPTLPKTIDGKVAEVRSGYLFRIDSHYIKLYGIDTPDPKQKCFDNNGKEYNCGSQSKSMLERMILNKKVSCQIVGGDYSGNYIATCKIKKTDIGVGMLTVGWAVADRKSTSVYIPYEEKAHKARLGLWAGHFVAPWKERQRVQESTNASSKGGFFESLFKK